MPGKAPSSRLERRYRCSECGRDEGLTAIAYGYMEGTLADDGLNLDDYSLGAESTDVCEDTINCPDHPYASVEKRVDGVWCRWETCKADGCHAGRVSRWTRWGDPGATKPCEACSGRGGHNVPIVEVASS
jgi:hypothetical protein